MSYKTKSWFSEYKTHTPLTKWKVLEKTADIKRSNTTKSSCNFFLIQDIKNNFVAKKLEHSDEMANFTEKYNWQI